jgi:curved DNA-binding protein CbpA
MNLYEVLGIKKDATINEIKAAHRSKIKKAHPDNQGDREEFEKVQHAYTVLKDPKKRNHYDEHGEEKEPEEDYSLALIAEIFNRLLMQDVPFDYDYLQGIKESLQNTVGEAVKQRIKCSIQYRKYERLQKKFRRKAGRKGSNFFREALKVRIREAKLKMQRADEVILQTKRAQQILDEYEFDRGETLP